MEAKEQVEDFLAYLEDLLELSQEALDCWHQSQVPDWSWGQMMDRRIKAVKEKYKFIREIANDPR